MKFLSTNSVSCVNNYIEKMATFTALVKIYSTEYFCNTKVYVAGLGEIFIQQTFSAIWYVLSLPLTHSHIHAYRINYAL